MSLDRVARLVRLAAAGSHISRAAEDRLPKSKPLDHQVRAIAPRKLPVLPLFQQPTADSGKEQPAEGRYRTQILGATRAVPIQARTIVNVATSSPTQAAVTASNDDDGLLPPEGSGQPPSPVLINVQPQPTPAPVRQPVPTPGRTPAPGPTPVRAPVPVPSASPAPAPVSRPSPATSATVPTPAPFGVPIPLGALPWQIQSSGEPARSVWMCPLPALPVFQQPQPSAGVSEPFYGLHGRDAPRSTGWGMIIRSRRLSSDRGRQRDFRLPR